VRLRLLRLQVVPTFILVDDSGEILDEVTAESVTMFPAKFIPFNELIKQLEEEASKNTEQMEELRMRPVLCQS
jgi:hypothetical protein